MNTIALNGWEIDAIPMRTDAGSMMQSRQGSMVNPSLGLGISTFSAPSSDGEMCEAVFNLTHLATGLRIVAITGNIGDVLGTIAAIAQLTDWTKERPDNIEAIAPQVRQLVGDAAWRSGSLADVKVVGHG